MSWIVEGKQARAYSADKARCARAGGDHEKRREQAKEARKRLTEAARVKMKANEDTP